MLYTHIPEISCFYANSLNSEILKPTAHYECEMILVTDGKARVIIEHKTYELKRGSLVFISRLEGHNFIIEETPYARYVISMSSNIIISHIKDNELLSIFIQRPKNFCHVMALNEKTLLSLLPLFEKLNQEFIHKASFYQGKSISILIEILIDLYRKYPKYFPNRGHSNAATAVVDAQRYINENYRRRLTLDEVAGQTYVGRHTLSLAFRDIVGVTFKEYLILFRITEAKKLLITTDLSVYEIGTQVGYVNVNNFVKIFREHENITPLQYRKRYSSNLQMSVPSGEESENL